MTGFASPNHTQTPNDLFDVLLAEIDSLAELKVTLAVIRKTLGYHKKKDPISYSQLEKLTGMGRQAVQSGIEKAIARGTVEIVGTGSRGVNIFGLVLVDQYENHTSEPDDQYENHTSSSMKIKLTKETTQKKKDSAAVASGEKSKPKAVRPPNKNEPWRNELLRCFGLTPETVTKTGDKTYWVAASDLVKISFPVEKIAALHEWCSDQRWPNFTVMALAKHAGEWLADNDGESDDPYAQMFSHLEIIGGMPNEPK